MSAEKTPLRNDEPGRRLPNSHVAPLIIPQLLSAEQIIANKLSRFAQSRRTLAQELARRHNLDMPPDVESFFAAVESGDWEQIETAFDKINGGDSSAGKSDTRPPGIEHLWPAIIDAYGAAQQAHEWPAQQLLDYGESILSSLKPGMIYVGGTDDGRWVPALLNDTNESDRHVVITQNGLADTAYLEYLRLQFDSQLNTLSQTDFDSIYQEYSADAERRLKHDDEHPDEPRQVRTGEVLRMVDGKLQITGQTAVMTVNERLLNILPAKNPDLSFAMQESFPFRTIYTDSLPRGQLMELRGSEGQATFDPDRAAQSVNYWKATAQQILENPDTSASPVALQSYSHNAVAAANLLAANSATLEAEQTYRLATQFWPGNPESIVGLADLLSRTGRDKEGQKLIKEFLGEYPNEAQVIKRLQDTSLVSTSARPPEGFDIQPMP